MKTAISLPDQIYYEAEKTARCMGVPRSKLYADALSEYINNRKRITEQLNEVYGDDYYREFEPVADASLECMRASTKHDAW